MPPEKLLPNYYHFEFIQVNRQYVKLS